MVVNHLSIPLRQFSCMKYVLPIGLLLLGLGLGYVIAVYTYEPEAAEVEPSTEYITETVVDTVIQKETVQVPIAEEVFDSTKLMTDSLMALLDTLVTGIEVDTIEDLTIRTEKMVGQKWLTVTVLEEFEDKDSLIKEMLGINDKMPTSILVEFWESPLNFSGYKLSRSKLIMYGMPKGMDYKLYRRKGDYFLSAQSFYYSLKETEEFLPYLEVAKEVVFND